MIVIFALAQLLDGASAVAMTSRYEANAGARLLLDQPVLAIAMKAALIVMVIAIATIVARKRPVLASWLYVVGILAGVVGFLSNVAVIRALEG